MKSTIGIIGGMGPMATADLYEKIVGLTPAKSDNEHIHILIDNNVEIPDRTASILGYGEDALYELVRSAIKLESMGANFLIMPCNTAHYYYYKILDFIKIPFLNMLEETAKQIQKLNIRTIGLLATDGTIKSRVYHNVFEKYKINVVTPDDEGQKEVMNIIYNGIKKSNYSIDINAFLSVINTLFDQGAEYLVLGCTELPIAFDKFDIKSPFVDPTMILAKTAVDYALKLNF